MRVYPYVCERMWREWTGRPAEGIVFMEAKTCVASTASRDEMVPLTCVPGEWRVWRASKLLVFCHPWLQCSNGFCVPFKTSQRQRRDRGMRQVTLSQSIVRPDIIDYEMADDRMILVACEDSMPKKERASRSAEMSGWLKDQMRGRGLEKILFKAPVRDWSLVTAWLGEGSGSCAIGLALVESDALVSLIGSIHSTSLCVLSRCKPLVPWVECQANEAPDADDTVDWYALGVSIGAAQLCDAPATTTSWDAVLAERLLKRGARALPPWRPGSFLE